MGSESRELQIYRDVIGMTGSVAFYYNMQSGMMEMFHGSGALSRYGSQFNNYVQTARTTHMLAGTDESVKEMYLNTLLTGEPSFFEYELRITNPMGAPHWYKVSGKAVYGDDNNPVAIVGHMQNIDERMGRKPATVADDNQMDVTGVLRKTYFLRDFGDKCIKRAKSEGVLVLLGIVGINDYANELSGIKAEQFLTEVAQLIKDKYRFDVVIGRINYSEFGIIYFGEDIPDFIGKLDDLIGKIRILHINEAGKVKIACGMLRFTFNEGEEFDILTKVRIAFKTSRYYGKSQVVEYSADLERINSGEMPSEGYKETYQKALFDHDLIEKSLDIISQTGDVEGAVNMILNKLGHKYGLGRIAVAELDKMSKTAIYSYVWIDPNDERIKAKFSTITPMPYEYMISYYDNHEVVVCDDVRNANESAEMMSRINELEVQAYVHCMFSDGMNKVGAVLFEDFVKPRKWDDADIETFKFMTKLISAFLLNMRAYEEMLLVNKHYVTHDSLTGLYKFNDFMKEAKNYIRKNRGGKFAVLYSRMKEFPKVNDLYGYDVGDEVLRLYSRSIKAQEEVYIIGARINADNFIALVNQFDSRGNAISASMLDVLNGDFTNKANAIADGVDLSLCVGVSMINDTAIPLNEYFSRAIEARNAAFEAGERYRVF